MAEKISRGDLEEQISQLIRQWINRFGHRTPKMKIIKETEYETWREVPYPVEFLGDLSDDEAMYFIGALIRGVIGIDDELGTITVKGTDGYTGNRYKLHYNYE